MSSNTLDRNLGSAQQALSIATTVTLGFQLALAFSIYILTKLCSNNNNNKSKPRTITQNNNTEARPLLR
jgi:hypothetical protein